MAALRGPVDGADANCCATIGFAAPRTMELDIKELTGTLAETTRRDRLSAAVRSRLRDPGRRDGAARPQARPDNYLLSSGAVSDVDERTPRIQEGCIRAFGRAP